MLKQIVIAGTVACAVGHSINEEIFSQINAHNPNWQAYTPSENPLSIYSQQ